MPERDNAATSARVACAQLLDRFHASVDAGRTSDAAGLFFERATRP